MKHARFLSRILLLAGVAAFSVTFASCGSDDNDEPIPQPEPETAFEDQVFTVNGQPFQMVAVQGGTFQMGSYDGLENELPVHSVTLSDYYIGQTEVRQELWQAVMGSLPANNEEGGKYAVEKISYATALQFIEKLNELTGKKFRLPTEAEWEYAARGGNKSQGYIYSGSNNIDDVAWYHGNWTPSIDVPWIQKVAQKKPNELGIYDMSGNAREWCSDYYGAYGSEAQTNPQGPATGVFRVLRGGYWQDYKEQCRNTARYSAHPTDLDPANPNGLRLALSK